MKRFQWAILIATMYLLVYVVLLDTGVSLRLASAFFALSPLPVLYMVYHILRAPYQGKELQEGEEFGYGDKRREDLWIV